MNIDKKKASSIITHAKLGDLNVAIKNQDLLNLLNVYYRLAGSNKVNKNTIINSKKEEIIANVIPLKKLKEDLTVLQPYLNGSKDMYEDMILNIQENRIISKKEDIELDENIKKYIDEFIKTSVDDYFKELIEKQNEDKIYFSGYETKEIDFNNPEDIKLINEVIKELGYEGDFKHSEVLGNMEDKKELEKELKEYQGGLTNKEYEDLKRKLKKEYNIDI